MNGSMIFALAVIGAIVYWLIGFVNQLDDEVDVSYGYNERRAVGGEEFENMNSLSVSEQKKRWNSSETKKEMISLFPNFTEMEFLIDDKLGDSSSLKQGLLKELGEVQRAFMSGKISADGAKEKLRSY